MTCYTRGSSLVNTELKQQTQGFLEHEKLLMFLDRTVAVTREPAQTGKDRGLC